MCSTCRILAQRNESLEAELDQLKAETRARDYRAPEEFNLTATQERILGMLIRNDRIISVDAIFDATRELPNVWATERGDKLVHTVICKMRKSLAPHAVLIETVKGYGYRLSPATRQRLLNWNAQPTIQAA